MDASGREPAAEVIRRYWDLMRTNEFAAVGRVLADGFVLHWPQTRSQVVGREAFARANAEYPTKGRWSFDVQRLVAAGDQVVTDTVVTSPGVITRAISFFTVTDGLIERMVEYWPEDVDPTAG